MASRAEAGTDISFDVNSRSHIQTKKLENLKIIQNYFSYQMSLLKKIVSSGEVSRLPITIGLECPLHSTLFNSRGSFDLILISSVRTYNLSKLIRIPHKILVPLFAVKLAYFKALYRVQFVTKAEVCLCDFPSEILTCIYKIWLHSFLLSFYYLIM